MLHFEGEPEKYREYDFSIDELLDIVLKLNNSDPNGFIQTKAVVNQERMALFLKNVEFWRRFIKEERDIGVDIDIPSGCGSIVVYLSELEFENNEFTRFIRSLDSAADFSIYPVDEEEINIRIAMSGLFEAKESKQGENDRQ